MAVQAPGGFLEDELRGEAPDERPDHSLGSSVRGSWTWARMGPEQCLDMQI